MNKEMWLIWKEPEKRRRYKIGTLVKDDAGYEFKYVNPELDDAKEVGFNYFPGFEDTNKVYRSNSLFANIATRLPNVNRPDYLEILNAYNLEKDSSEFEILLSTKGRLVTDNYEFVPSFDQNKVEFDVAGTRHCDDVSKCKEWLSVNSRLYLEPEPDNVSDKDAIKVMFVHENVKYHLGYVPRYYSHELLDLLNKKTDYSAMIQCLNFETELSDENITACVKLIFSI